MKQLSFGEIIGRAVIAFAVAIAPTSSAFAEAVPSEIAPNSNVIKVNFTTRMRVDDSADEVYLQLPLDLPPAAVLSNTVNLHGSPTDPVEIKYETITIRTESPQQYAATMNWANAQMTYAKANEITYRYVNLVPDTADGAKAGQAVEETVAPEHREAFVTIPVAPDKKFEPSWAKKMWAKLGEKTLKVLGPHRTADLLAIKGVSKMAVLNLARNETAYKATFSLTRVFINGYQAYSNIMQSTKDLGIALLAGAGYMGGLSGSLQWYQTPLYKNFLLKEGPITKASQRGAVKLAEKMLGSKLTQKQIRETNNRIRKVSATNKWGLLEVGFFGGAQLIMAFIGGYAVLEHGAADVFNAAFGQWATIDGGIVTPTVNFIGAVLSAMFAQSSFDTGNGEQKELADNKATTEDELVMNKFMEHLRAILISVVSVGALSKTMSSPELGYAVMISMGLTGILYRNWVSKKAHLFDCEQALQKAARIERVRQHLLELEASDK